MNEIFKKKKSHCRKPKTHVGKRLQFSSPEPAWWSCAGRQPRVADAAQRVGGRGLGLQPVPSLLCSPESTPDSRMPVISPWLGLSQPSVGPGAETTPHALAIPEPSHVSPPPHHLLLPVGQPQTSRNTHPRSKGVRDARLLQVRGRVLLRSSRCWRRSWSKLRPRELNAGDRGQLSAGLVDSRQYQDISPRLLRKPQSLLDASVTLRRNLAAK